MSATSVTIDVKLRAKGRVLGGNWTRVPIIFLAYALLYDNSTSTPSAAGADWTQFLQLPREIRIVEAACVLIAILVVMNRGFSRFSRRLLIAAAVFSALGLGSHITHPLVSLIDVFRLIYAYILPLLIFVIGREARLNARSRELIWRFLLGWVILNALVSWYQFVWLGYPVGDDITGLNKDAHANGNLMFFASLMFVAFALFQRRKKLLFGAMALVVTAILPSVLKSLVFSLFACMLIVWVSISSRTTSTGRKMKPGFRKRIVPITVTVVLLVVAGLSFSDIDRGSSARVGDAFDKLLANPMKFGPFSAHVASLGLVSTSAKTFLLGNGPYSYANPISVGQGLAAGQLAKFAQSSLLPEAFESGESTKITLTSCVLAELGFLAFVTLLWAYLAIGLAVWRARQSTDPNQVAYATGLTGWWLILFLTALMSMFGSLDIISISWPVMFLVGITCRIGDVNVANERSLRMTSQ